MQSLKYFKNILDFDKLSKKQISGFCKVLIMCFNNLAVSMAKKHNEEFKDIDVMAIMGINLLYIVENEGPLEAIKHYQIIFESLAKEMEIGDLINK